MDNFTFYNPTRIYFGRNEENQIGERVLQTGAQKILIHYGSDSAVKSGLIYRITSLLERMGLNSVSLGGVRPNPRSDLVYDGIEICKRENIDFILAVGGGSVIDSAKAIALGACYDGDFWDIFSNKATPVNALNIGTVLTIAASGSETSPVSVITHTNGWLKRPYSNDLMRPVFSILNPELTMSVPAFHTACGAIDIMAHVIERYFTNTPNVELTDRLCEAVLITVKNELPRVLENPNDYDARANLMWASTMAHSDICGVGREQDWASHILEHELSAKYDCAHGAGLAVIMPAWMSYVMHHDIARFAQFAVNVWGCDMNFANPTQTARAGIYVFTQFMKSMGLPTQFSEIHARESDISDLIKQLKIGNTATIGSFVKLSYADCEKIYHNACSSNPVQLSQMHAIEK